MPERTAAGHEVFSLLADGEWHRLGEIAEPLKALADHRLCVAIALGCIAGLRDKGYEIERDEHRYRLVSTELKSVRGSGD